MRNKKVLYITTTLFILILIISFIILSILGSKIRIGYLSDFNLNIDSTLELNNFPVDYTKELFTIDNKLDNNALNNYILTNEDISYYNYNFRIRYYDKVFRNSDIYGVYINTNEIVDNNNFIKDLSIDGGGSPFGNIVTTIKMDSNIDNINYTLKVKLKLYIILFILIIFINIIPLLNNNRLYIILSMCLIFIYIFFHNRTFFYWDTINYISRGINIFYGKELWTYPGTLFSIITTIPTMFLFGNTQVSYLFYMSLIPNIITVIFSYRLLIRYMDKVIAACILLFIFIIFPSYVPTMLAQPYTDGWLLMFIVLSIYYMMNNNIYLSAIFISIAYFFRSSFALPLGLFIPLLLENNNNIKMLFSKKSLLSYSKYFIILILNIVIIQFIFNLFIKTQTSEHSFYLTLLNNEISLIGILNCFITVIKVFNVSIIPIFILSIISIFLITRKNLNIELKKISLIGIIYFMISSSATTMLVFKGYNPIQGENRYFIYPLLILLVSTIALLYEYIMNSYNIKNKYIKILTISILLVAIIKMCLFINIPSLFSRMRLFDYDKNYPHIEENSKVFIIGTISQGTLNYIFKNQSQHNGINTTFDDFYYNDNSNYEYVFSDRLITYDVIKDKYGNEFKLLWISNLGVKYSLYKNIKYEYNKKIIYGNKK